MSRNIQLSRKLQVLPGNIIIIPGGEPTTSITSINLEIELRKIGRGGVSIIDLRDALIAIPGSYIELLENSNAPIQKFLVLPAEEIDCPPEIHPDYYEILRAAARPANDDEKEMLAMCTSIDDYSHLLGS